MRADDESRIRANLLSSDDTPFDNALPPQSHSHLAILRQRVELDPLIGFRQKLTERNQRPIAHAVTLRDPLISARISRIRRSLAMISSTSCARGRCSKS